MIEKIKTMGKLIYNMLVENTAEHVINSHCKVIMKNNEKKLIK